MQASGTVGRKSFRSTVPPKPNPALEGTRGSGGLSLCGRFLRAPLSFAFGVKMGYDLHITRREYWSDEDGPEISLDEWMSYRSHDTELAQDPNNEGLESTIFVTRSEKWPLWWSRGEIYTKNPDDLVISKMVRIPAALNARVLGNDDAIYGSDPSDPSMAVPR
jgi:hypothetical protein